MGRSFGRSCRWSAFLAPSLLWAAPAGAQSVNWPDTLLGRVEALAVMQTLNAGLLGSRSATLTLERWCADHAMATEPKIVAQLVRDVEKPVSAEQRRRLQVGDHETVKYRRVHLSCGVHVLSEADNWYVPSRLTPEMNRLLETTDTPFGRAVQGLNPSRQTVRVEMLWSPLPDRWETRDLSAIPVTGGTLAVPSYLFEHQALLFTADRTPFSEVNETYSSAVLAFPPPAAPR
jgi:chorismate-pyruvate lyase